MIFFIAGISLFVLFIVYMHIETRLLSGSLLVLSRGRKPRVRKMKSYKEPVLKNIPDGDAIKFIHLTDIHVRRLYIPVEKIINAIEIHRPDFLILTGDYFQNGKEIDVFFNIMKNIRGKFSGDIFLCFGNHDRGDVFSKVEGSYERVMNFLNDINVTVLENMSALYRKNDLTLNIIGLSDARTNNADIEKLIAKTASSTYPNLVITHNCDILMKMQDGSVDFALAGHTHGAQVRTPFNIEIKLLHRKDKLSQQNIIRGLHRYREIDLYINRGLGNTCLPIRFLSRPEILVGVITK